MGVASSSPQPRTCKARVPLFYWQFASNLSGIGGRNSSLPATGRGFDFTNEFPPPPPLNRERSAYQKVRILPNGPTVFVTKYSPPPPSHFLSLSIVAAGKNSVDIYWHNRQYRYASHNDVSVNDGPHIQRWSHNIIIPPCYNCLQYSVQ